MCHDTNSESELRLIKQENFRNEETLQIWPTEWEKEDFFLHKQMIESWKLSRTGGGGNQYNVHVVTTTTLRSFKKEQCESSKKEKNNDKSTRLKAMNQQGGGGELYLDSKYE